MSGAAGGRAREAPRAACVSANAAMGAAFRNFRRGIRTGIVSSTTAECTCPREKSTRSRPEPNDPLPVVALTMADGDCAGENMNGWTVEVQPSLPAWKLAASPKPVPEAWLPNSRASKYPCPSPHFEMCGLQSVRRTSQSQRDASAANPIKYTFPAHLVPLMFTILQSYRLPPAGDSDFARMQPWPHDGNLSVIRFQRVFPRACRPPAPRCAGGKVAATENQKQK
jgi:hypothetical protein